MKLRVFAGVILLGAVAPALAWGPFAHQVIDAAAARRAATRPGLALLAEPGPFGAFVSAATLPDLTFSFTKGGKTDGELDELFHRPEFQTHLIVEARRAGHAPTVAFAYGWAGHVAGDERGNRPDAATQRDIFGMPEEHRHLETGMVKLLADGVLMRSTDRGSLAPPRLDLDLLSRALESYTGPGALPGKDAGAWRARLAELERQFAESYDLWTQVAHQVATNERLCRELSETVLGPGGTLPIADLDGSVDAVVAMLEATAGPTGTAAAAPAGGIIPLLGVAPTPKGYAGTTTVGRIERVMDLAAALTPMPGVFPRPLGPFRWLKDRAVAVAASVGLVALEHAPGRLLETKKRVFAAFCTVLIGHTGGFAELRDAVRKTLK